ncbi:filamentous hemagglutinin N-terminal domain-containing protein [Moorena sp. SIO3I6]|uniref:two-partner secretion domain-containing protein n=1 Tax=Moorena sp. SIO3I6 TaxID=2607831 RepID=UPI0013F8F12C|nr:filamentous hemagglutinin N-terminal domain-containing protein [Moorena sp. SIO3I6]NEP20899.1 filamentous hemagglutinin N-terminal domain-containing protein [Moorena sp. SIO3I6]
MKIVRTLVIFGGISLSGYYGITHSVNPALAQIVPDNTLGDNPSVVKPNVEVKGLPADLIEGGATRGDNLFHSFSDFNVGDLQRVYFANPAGINNILSRVTGSNISKIFGTLGVDGAANLFLLNPNGIVFGANSQLDVAGSFVGSTANSIVFGNGTEFSATNPEEPPLLTINITPGLQYGQNPPQPIVNAGNLAVGQGQNVTLVGGSIISTGDILAPGGEINILAVPTETLVQLGQAGQILTLSTPTPSIESNSPSVTEFLSTLDDDTGVTVSSDGQVTLTDSGTIVPLEPGTVIISGALNAANLSPGQTGGKVTVLGNQVGLFDSGSIDVSGNSSGGDALIGGDFQGQGQLPLATATYIGPDSTINADGISTGNGGLIVIWSNQSTRAYGTLTARGGAQSGNGGLIETSSANFLDVTGVRVDASAVNGNAGTWLLDPRNVTLGFADTSNGSFDSNSNIFTPTGDDAVVNIPDIEARLNAGTNVTITTGTTGTQEGNITADGFGITKTTPGEVTLSLQAANDISLKNFGINADSGFLNLVLEADSDNSGSGDVELMNGGIDTGGGAVTITAAGAIALESIGINRNNNRSDQAPPMTVISGESISLKNAGINSLTSGDNGNAGNVIVQTGTLTIEKAGIGSRTEGKGDAGNITITAADSVVVTNNSGISTNTQDNSTGDAGEITITAGSVLFENQSGIGSDTQDNSSGDAGKITITADSVVFREKSGIGSNTRNNSTGNAGEIKIKADSLSIANNSGLGSIASDDSTGNAGTITIDVGTLSLDNESEIGQSGLEIAANVDNIDVVVIIDTEEGDNAGNITIIADNISLTKQSIIDSNSNNSDQGGDISITVNELLLLRDESKIFANSGAPNSDIKTEGNAGNITITAGSLLLENDSDIESNTRGNSSGDAGIITITADSLVFGEKSGLGTNTQDNSTGDAGEITITAGSVLFEGQGSGLGSETRGNSKGNGGKIIINADSVVFRGGSGIGINTTDDSTGDAGEITITAGSVLFENQTGLGSDTQKNSRGNAGKITITADSLVFRNQSGLGTNTTDDSTGDAGEITITAGSVLFENQTGLGSDTNKNSSGDAGKITITADSLVLRQQSGLGTNTADNSTGDAGEITITAGSVLFENQGRIGSETQNNSSGNAGKITITADSLVLTEGSTIGTRTINNSTGDAGKITINADSISLENNSNISAQTFSGDGGNIILTLQDLLILRDGSQITTSAGTQNQPGNGGNITITADLILAFLEENSDITANAFDGNGGNIDLTAQGIFGFNFPDQPTDLSDITASSERGVDGNITINILGVNPSQGLVELPTTVVDPSRLIAATCADNVKVASDDSKGDEFIITGRGGLPPSPLDPIISRTVIADWVTLDNSATENYQSQRHSPAAREESARKRPKRRIVEAQGWLIGPDGTVILTPFPTTPETWANSWRKSPSCEDLRRITNGS